VGRCSHREVQKDRRSHRELKRGKKETCFLLRGDDLTLPFLGKKKARAKENPNRRKEVRDRGVHGVCLHAVR